MAAVAAFGELECDHGANAARRRETCKPAVKAVFRHSAPRTGKALVRRTDGSLTDPEAPSMVARLAADEEQAEPEHQ